MRRAAMLLWLAALSALPVSAQPASVRQSWWVYAGGATARSAMDSASVARAGSVARFNEVWVSTTIQRQTDGLPFDYMLAAVEYDCVARSARSTRIEYFDRTGKSLKVNERSDSVFVPAGTASEFAHFAPVACRDLSTGDAPGSYGSVADFLAGNAFWNFVAKR